jgi:hypothetical protein
VLLAICASSVDQAVATKDPPGEEPEWINFSSKKVVRGEEADTVLSSLASVLEPAPSNSASGEGLDETDPSSSAS